MLDGMFGEHVKDLVGDRIGNQEEDVVEQCSDYSLTVSFSLEEGWGGVVIWDDGSVERFVVTKGEAESGLILKVN